MINNTSFPAGSSSSSGGASQAAIDAAVAGTLNNVGEYIPLEADRPLITSTWAELDTGLDFSNVDVLLFETQDARYNISTFQVVGVPTTSPGHIATGIVDTNNFYRARVGSQSNFDSGIITLQSVNTVDFRVHAIRGIKIGAPPTSTPAVVVPGIHNVGEYIPLEADRPVVPTGQVWEKITTGIDFENVDYLVVHYQDNLYDGRGTSFIKLPETGFGPVTSESYGPNTLLRFRLDTQADFDAGAFSMSNGYSGTLSVREVYGISMGPKVSNGIVGVSTADVNAIVEAAVAAADKLVGEYVPAVIDQLRFDDSAWVGLNSGLDFSQIDYFEIIFNRDVGDVHQLKYFPMLAIRGANITATEIVANGAYFIRAGIFDQADFDSGTLRLRASNSEAYTIESLRGYKY